MLFALQYNYQFRQKDGMYINLLGNSEDISVVIDTVLFCSTYDS
jgi:hypothetical protein